MTFLHEGPINGKRRVAGTGEEVASSMASKTRVGKHKTEKKAILENDRTGTMNILRGKRLEMKYDVFNERTEGRK
jgi:hypothetical protein